MAKNHYHAALTTALCAAFSVTGAAVGQAGLVFQDSVVVEQADGAFSVTKDVTVCFDPSCPGADCCEDGKPITVTMQYTGEDCSASSNSQADDKWDCDDFAALQDVVYIVASKDEDCEDDIFFAGTVNVGETYVIDGRLAAATFEGDPKDRYSDVVRTRMSGASGFGRQTDLGFPSPSGDTLPSNVYICIFDEEGGTLLQQIKFHASCSQPLNRGDQFGSARVVDCLGEDEPDPNDACCNGKPVRLTMTYTGNDCDPGANSQGSKFECEAFGALPDTVYLVASDDEDCEDDIYFQGTVSVGDEYVIDADAIGEDKLSSATYICIYDMEGGTLLQHVEFHTSCSAPLNFGDGFGGSTLVAAVGEDGECEPPMEPCDPFPMDGLFTYTYKLTNHCDSPLGLIAFEVVVNSGVVADAGFLDGAGVQPSAVTIEDNRVEWDFFDMIILPCEMSSVLYITSPLGPDAIDVSISGMAGLDTPTECVGPVVECAFCPGDGPCYSCPFGVGQGPPCEIPPFDCDDKVVELTMIWDGTQPVRIRAYDGEVGANLLADIDNIQVGDEVTVGPLAGPNDSFWEVFEAGTDNLIGLSKFHRSCSDSEMNDETDCGNRQGNGKSNESGLINDWILEGLVDGSGNVLDCGTP